MADKPALTFAQSRVHEPIGKPGGPGLWHQKTWQLPAYIQIVRDRLMSKRGLDEHTATHIAVGIVEAWSKGLHGASPSTVAKATAAIADLHAMQAKLKVRRSKMAGTPMTCDADGLDASWDGPHDDLPDLTGIGTPDLDAAQEQLGIDDAEDTASRAAKPKLGTGTRFKKLQSSLAGKGAKDPGALAAWIGRKKMGKANFAKIAAHARKKGAKTAAASRSGEWFRPAMPLEECTVLTRGSYAGESASSGRIVEAYATVFGQPAEIHDHEGDYEETIDRAAFNRTLEHVGPHRNNGRYRVQVLYNHGLTVHGTPAERFSLPVGRPLEILPEERGLLTRTYYADTPLGNEVLDLVREGMILSQSFTGRIVRSDPQLRPGAKYRATAGRLPQVHRLELGLREYGPTPFPAYAGAEVVGVRMSPLGTYADTTGADYLAEQYDLFGDGAALLQDGELADEGGPAADDPASRLARPDPSLSHRLYLLRYHEQCERAGITLPGGTLQ